MKATEDALSEKNGSATVVSSKPVNPTASAEPVRPVVNGPKRPSLLECPHCDEMSGNDDAPNLRLHIFHHYKEHWAERVSFSLGCFSNRHHLGRKYLKQTAREK